MTTESNKQTVFQKIALVSEDLSREGIDKSNKNAQQGYNFRGIDAVHNTLSPILARHKLVIMPECLERNLRQETAKSGNSLNYVDVKMKYTLTSADDGSSTTVIVVGEAMDSADKATNKAMSAAYKYMAIQTFCIPVQGADDADVHSYEVISAERNILMKELESIAKEGANKLNAKWSTLSTRQKSIIGDEGKARLKEITDKAAENE